MGANSPRKRGNQPAWRAAASGKDAPREGQYKWKPAEEAEPRSVRRRLKQGALALGALACLGGCIWLVLLILPAPRATLIGVSANPADDADLLDVPLDLYGWQTANQFTKLGQEQAEQAPRSLFSRQAAPPPTDGGGPLALPPTEDGLAAWANRLASSAFDPLVIYVGLHGATDAAGQAVLFTGKRGSDGRPNRLRVSALLNTLTTDPLKDKKKVLILDPGRLPLDPVYGHIHDDFAARVKALNAQIAADPHLVVMCGTSAGIRAWESEELQATAFGHAVLQALKGDLETDGSDVINARQLFEAVDLKTREWTQNNRPTAQEPFLLPEGGEGLTRAAKIEVGVRPRNRPPAPTPAPFTPGDLASRWATHDRLAAESPGPAAYSPRAWRRYRELLLRYEQAIRAGDEPTAAKLATALGTAQMAIEEAARPLPLDSARNSLALWSVVNAGGVTPPAPEGFGLGSDPAKTNRPTALRDQVGAAHRLLQQLAGDSGNGFGDRLGRAAPLLRKFPPDERPAEAHLPVMVEDFYTGILGRTASVAPGEWSQAVTTRVRAERAAVGQPEPNAPIPDRLTGRGPVPLYPERTWPLTRHAVLTGDLRRRTAEDALFAEPGDRAAAVDHLKKAREAYDAAAEMTQALRTAFDTRDTVFADLPYLTQWAAERAKTPAAVTSLGSLWDQAHALAADLDALPTKVPGPDDARGATAYAEAVKKITADARRIAQEFGKLRGEFFDEIDRRRTDAALQQEWEVKQQLLRVPFIPAEKRSELLRDSRAASAKLQAGGVKQPKFAAGDAKAEARDAAWARGRLARVALGAEVLDLQHKDGGLLPKADFLDKDLLDLKNTASGDPAKWGDLAAKIGADLAGHLAQLAAKPPTGSAAERLSRVALPLSPESGLEPAAIQRRLRWRDFLTGLAERTADDHWYDEKYDPTTARGAGQAGRYFRRAADRYLANARGITEELPGQPPFTPPAELTAKLNTPPLTVTDPPPVTWTSERERAVVFAADPVPKTYPIVGHAVGIRQFGQADPLQAAGVNPAERPLLPVRADQLRLEATLSLDPKLDSFTGNRSLAGAFYFRGQRPTQTLAIDLRRSPDLILADPLPTPGESGALVAIRADKNLTLGAVAILFDFSGSMAGSLEGMELPDWKTNRNSKYNIALDTLEEVLRGLPRKTPLRVRIFSDKASGSDQSRVVFRTDSWDPDELPDLMGKLRSNEPKYFTPLIRSIMTAAEEDFDHVREPIKTLLVLTDGAEEAEGESFTDRLERIKNSRQKMYDALDSRSVQMYVVQAGLSETDRKLSQALFEALPDQKLPGGVWSARDRLQLREALLSAIRPKLKLRPRVERLPEGFPRAGWPSRAEDDPTQDRRFGLYWSRPLPSDLYAASPSPGRRAAETDLFLADGDRMILEFVRDGPNAIRVRRKLYAELPAAQSRAVYRADRGWVATLQGHYVAIDRREPQYRARVFLERVPADREDRIELTRPAPPQSMLWWDVAAEGPNVPADHPLGTIEVRKRYAYHAPAWDVYTDRWPQVAGGFAAAKLRLWVIDSLRGADVRDYELDWSGKVRVGDDEVTVRVTCERQPILSRGEGGEDPECLVVRVTHPGGRPVFVRYVTNAPHNARHSYYRLRRGPKDTRDGEYTALFGPFPRSLLSTARIRLEFFPVAPDDRKVITLTPPKPESSVPPEMDYQPQPAPEPSQK